MEYFSSASSSSSSASSLAAHFNGKAKKKTPKRSSSSSGNNTNTTTSSTVKLSTDPQSVAARERRHRISDRFKILQSLVPGGSKMDTVSMLEEAINYVKFLKTQIMLHQTLTNIMDHNNNNDNIDNVDDSYNNYVLNPPYNQEQQQQFNPTYNNLLDPNFVVEGCSVSLPLSDSLFQGEEEAAAMYYHLLGKN